MSRHSSEAGSSSDPAIADGSNTNPTLLKTKRKRLAKACDPCHKSKRRCDGSNPCANCEFAGKRCSYTDSSGRRVPPPNPSRSVVKLEERSLSGSRHSPENHRLPPSAPWLRNPSEYTYNGSTQSNPILLGQFAAPLSTPSTSQSIDHPRENATRRRQPPPSRRSSSPFHVASRAERYNFPSPSIGRRLCPDDLRIEPSLFRELVNLFFTHIHPCNIILHRPTFLSGVSVGAVPQYLLHAVCSVSAPLSSHPSLRPQGSQTTPSWQLGDRFAAASCRAIFDSQNNIICPRNLECAQALCLLSAQHVNSRSHGSKPIYIASALAILTELGVPQWDSRSCDTTSVDLAADLGENKVNSTWIRRECHRRTLWLAYWASMSVGAITRGAHFLNLDDIDTFLPMNDALFELSVPSESKRVRAVDVTSPHQDSSLSEFGYLVRLSNIYARIKHHLSERSRPRTGIDVGKEATDNKNAFDLCEKSLRAWKTSLPPNLQLNEENMRSYITSLNLGANSGSWSYAYMHGIAHCATISLYEWLVLEHDSEGMKMRTQEWTEAYDGLMTIMRRLGQHERVNLAIVALLIHLVPMPSQTANPTTRLHPDVKLWLDEYREHWGISLDQILSVEWRSEWLKTLWSLPTASNPYSVTTSTPPAHFLHDTPVKDEVPFTNEVQSQPQQFVQFMPKDSPRSTDGFSNDPFASVLGHSSSTTLPRLTSNEEYRVAIPPSQDVPPLPLHDPSDNYGLRGIRLFPVLQAPYWYAGVGSAVSSRTSSSRTNGSGSGSGNISEAMPPSESFHTSLAHRQSMQLHWNGSQSNDHRT